MSAKILSTTLFSFLFVGIFSVAPTVLADSGTYHVLADIPNFEGVIPDTFKLGDYVVGIFKVGIGLAGVLAVIMLIMAGISYMMSELVGSKEEAKSQMGNAVFGLLLALGAYTILNTINPDILCLRFLGSDCAQGGGNTTPTPPVVDPDDGDDGNVTPPPNPNSGCAPGTTSLGNNEVYINGSATTTELCALSNLNAPSGRESTPGDTYYVDGANGKAIVAASVSANWYALIQAAIADGMTLTAESSYRTNQHQEDLYQDYLNGTGNLAAPPGTSNHQNGSAIDFDGMSASRPQPSNCANRATEPNNPEWVWLRDHAHNYGIKQFSRESWHWDSLNDSTRC